ncbi:MAG: metal ABC transporter ATP-binding protein [Candidatus Dormibacteraeota bacterium]|nr:metal ABC transporter ATP-binding protein [Candidatus Dormibacteraeota bacterium]
MDTLLREVTATEDDAPILQVRGLGVTLGGRQVLRDVDLALAPGTFTGLIGSNGAGKTTLFKVILGQLSPSAGRVLVAGHPRRARQRLVGYVPQKVQLDLDAPVRARDLVGLGLDGHRLGVPLPTAGRRRRIEEALAQVDALHFADQRVGALSGGEQQRVLLAAALIGRPRLLLLDEPLANLDLGSQREVVAALRRIVEDEGISVFLSAHDMNPLLQAMDRIVYLAQGRAASGTVQEVVRSDVLSELYGEPVDVVRAGGRYVVLAGGGGSLEGGHCDPVLDRVSPA